VGDVTIPGLCRSLLDEGDSQVLVEYALLAVLVAIASYGALQLLAAALQQSYTSWDSGTQQIWQTPAPGAGT
jgi:Flp pilus assembly pilin Flp